MVKIYAFMTVYLNFLAPVMCPLDNFVQLLVGIYPVVYNWAKWDLLWILLIYLIICNIN